MLTKTPKKQTQESPQNIEAEHVTQYFMNCHVTQNFYYSSNGAQAPEKPSVDVGVEPDLLLPPELATEKAMRVWRRLMQRELVDENFQPLVSRPKAALLADAFATYLKLDVRWKYFEQAWHRNNMRQDYNKGMALRSYDVFMASINDLFAD